MILNEMHDRMDTAVHGAPYVICTAEINASRFLLIFRHMDGMADHFVNALIFCGGDRNYRNAEKTFHFIDENGTPVFPHFVHHVERHHHGNVEFHELKREIEVALNV